MNLSSMPDQSLFDGVENSVRLKIKTSNHALGGLGLTAAAAIPAAEDIFYILNGLMTQAIGLFGGIENRRRSLRVKIFSCTDWLVGKEMGSFCQQLKELVGYRAAVVEVYSSLWLLRMSAYRALDDEARSERITNSVSRIMVAVAEELEPSFGPAISSFKLKPGNAPVLNEKPLIFGDTVLKGWV